MTSAMDKTISAVNELQSELSDLQRQIGVRQRQTEQAMAQRDSLKAAIDTQDAIFKRQREELAEAREALVVEGEDWRVREEDLASRLQESGRAGKIQYERIQRLRERITLLETLPPGEAMRVKLDQAHALVEKAEGKAREFLEKWLSEEGKHKDTAVQLDKIMRAHAELSTDHVRLQAAYMEIRDRGMEDHLLEQADRDNALNVERLRAWLSENTTFPKDQISRGGVDEAIVMLEGMKAALPFAIRMMSKAWDSIVSTLLASGVDVDGLVTQTAVDSTPTDNEDET